MPDSTDRPAGVLRFADVKNRFPNVSVPTLYKHAPEIPGFFRLGRMIFFKEQVFERWLAGGGEISPS